MFPIDSPRTGRGQNPAIGDSPGLTVGAFEVIESAPTLAPAAPPGRPSLLIIFTHGLGDCVQLQVVLRHLREFWPDWDVDVLIGRGKASAVRHLCRRVYEWDVDAPPDRGVYTRVEDLGWYENYTRDPRYPQTKPTNCLKEVFGIEPRLDLFRYDFPRAGQSPAREYLERISNGRKVLALHYQGNTSEAKKNLPHEVAAALCTFARRCGWVTVILDWDRRTPLADDVHVFNPGAENPIWGGSGTGDAGAIADLVEAADLFVGVDSGPLHVAAGVTSTPAIGVWLDHLPVQFCDIGDHVLHLVPENWRTKPPVNEDSAVSAFMAGRYRLREYPIADGLHYGANLGLIEALSEVMQPIVQRGDGLDEFRAKLRENFHSDDLPKFTWWLSYYETLHTLAGTLTPKTIVEIGVRAGYSGLTFLDASPECTITGIDFYGDEKTTNTHGGRAGFIEHARKILPEDRYTLVVGNSQQMTELPKADLVYIDGDHTFDGCSHDLELAAVATNWILVDDYDSISTVRQACDQWADRHPEFCTNRVDNFHSGLFMAWKQTPLGGNLILRQEFWVRADNVQQDRVIIRDIFEEDAYQLRHLPSNVGPGEVVVDVGAHIGAFTRKWHSKNPAAKIYCVEVCPENLPALRANVGEFATIQQAACTYETGPLALLNACYSNCESTGGSTVVPDNGGALLAPQDAGRYLEDRRPIERVTLEEIMSALGVGHIDVLKLDCEGSEYSILEHSPAVHDGRVRFVLGEYHGVARWNEFRARVFPKWDYGHMFESGECGIFHLRSPHPCPRPST